MSTSRWRWLTACAVIGAVAVSVLSVLSLRWGLRVADGFFSLANVPLDAPRRISISLMFGLIRFGDTSFPYAWAALDGAIRGAVFGGAVWSLGLAVVLLWHRRNDRRTGQRI